MKQKIIIFDWSGVIQDSVSSHLWIVNKIFEEHGVTPITLFELKKNWKQPYILFYEKYIPGISLEEEQERYNNYLFASNKPKSIAFFEIAGLLKRLKTKGHFLAVVSSDNPEVVHKEIKENELEDVFDEIVADVHDKLEGVKDVMKKITLNSEDTYFVGDSNHEIEVAKELGIKSVAVTWGFCLEEDLKTYDPDYVVHDIEELERVLI